MNATTRTFSRGQIAYLVSDIEHGLFIAERLYIISDTRKSISGGRRLFLIKTATALAIFHLSYIGRVPFL